MKYSTSFQTISIATVFHLKLLTELMAINVAWNKTGRDCNAEELPNSMFDGKTDIAVKLSDKCAISTYIEVDLSDHYAINYVILFEGKDPGKLGYFIIERGVNGLIEKCSEYPGIKPARGPGLRVNCSPSNLLFRLIKIESLKSEGMILAEIEVHTIASEVLGEKALINRGCSKRFDGQRVKTRRPLLQHCQLECLRRTQTFFALKLYKCFCGVFQNDSELISEVNCNIKCDDGTGTCGGINSYSVYLIATWLPSYKGCVENALMEMTEYVKISDSMTIPECIKYCDDHQYAVLQEGNTCSCREKIPLGFSDESRDKCNTECSGNSDTFCGGPHYASIYSTCLNRRHHTLKCSELLKCSGLYDEFGICGGVCEDNYIGDYCMKRVAPEFQEEFENSIGTIRPSLMLTNASMMLSLSQFKSNVTSQISSISKKMADKCITSDPCRSKSNSICIIFKGKVVCNCLNGYTKNKSTGACEDINECHLRPCHAISSICQNLDGSYFCECRQGFVRMSENNCSGDNLSDKLISDDDEFPTKMYLLFGGVSLLLLASLYWTYCASISTEDLTTSS